MAFHVAVAGERLTAAQWNDFVFKRAVIDCTSSTRPASPVTGEPILETDTKDLLAYDGAAWSRFANYGDWTTFTPTWTCSGTAPALGNGTLTGQYHKPNRNTGFVIVQLAAGSTTTFGTGNFIFALPSGWTGGSLPSEGTGIGFGPQFWPMVPFVAASATTITPYAATATADVRLVNMTGTAPFTWANTHVLYMQMVVKLA